MSKNFRETLNRQLENDAKFRKEYEALSPEYEIAKMLIACRNSGNLNQKQLSDKPRTGSLAPVVPSMDRTLL